MHQLIEACDRAQDRIDQAVFRFNQCQQSIKTTQKIDFDFQKLGIYVWNVFRPNEEQVKWLMMAKTGKRLEILMRSARKHLSELEKHVIFFRNKLEHISKKKAKGFKQAVQTQQQKLQKNEEVLREKSDLIDNILYFT